jgi:Flp pilus assembly protein TadG
VIRKRIRKEEGAVAVEFAVIMILLSMILFGIIEFGITLSKYEVYLGAAREGARYAAVRCKPESSSGCTNTLIATRVQNAATGYSLSNAPTADKNCGDLNTGSEVTVLWNQHFSLRIPFVPDLSFDKDVKGVFRCE